MRRCIGVALQTTGGAPGAQSSFTSPCPADARTAGRLGLPGLVPGMQLTGRGLSSSGSVLYRGQLTAPDPVPPALDLTLYFTGGQ